MGRRQLRPRPEAKRVEVEGEEADSKTSSAIVPTVARPEDYLTVRFVHFHFSVVLTLVVENHEKGGKDIILVLIIF